jgi:hypothetical protein
MERKSKVAIVIGSAVLATALYAQDKYSLKSPGESRFRTSRDTRTGRWCLRPGRTRC